MDRSYKLILAASFIPLIYKVLLYSTIGSFEPLLVAAIYGGWLLLGYYLKSRWFMTAIKAWAISLIIYGVIRLLLQGLLQVAEVSIEAQIRAQLNLGYAAISVMYLFLGRWLMINRKQVVG